MTKGIIFGVLLGVLVVAPVSAQAAGCFNPTGPEAGFAPFVTMAIEVTGVTFPFFSLVGEVVSVNVTGNPPLLSWPLTGGGFIRADGTLEFVLVGAFGANTVTLNPPGYNTGSVGGSQGPVALTAVACPPLPE